VAESVLLGLRTAAVCGSCGKALAADLSAPATFCRECGCCLLVLPRTPCFPILVPPRVEVEAAWGRLRSAAVRGDRARMTAWRLLFVPFHEWAPDLGRTRVIRDAHALISPAADLLPAGLRSPAAPLGDDVRALAIAKTAHRGRLADPAAGLSLIRKGEAVDVMIPSPARAPEGADPTAGSRLLYYPFWFLTYRIDWTEHRGVVDAVTGEPVGPSAAPRRWTPAVLSAAAGLGAFAALGFLLKPLGSPAVQSICAAAVSWAAARVTLARLLRHERGR